MLRRTFLQAAGLSVMGLTMRTQASARILKSSDVTPRGSAENLIFIFLQGAPSHVDLFDLKLGSWTPDDFEPNMFGNLHLPAGLLPNLSQQASKFSLLHSITGSEAVHARASFLLETAHNFNPVFAQEQPHFGSVMAYELFAQRRETDILPPFLSINSNIQGPGMLPSAYAAFTFSSANGVTGLTHPDGEAIFLKRFQSLLNIDGKDRLEAAAIGDRLTDYHNFYNLGQQMMYEPDATAAFTLSDQTRERYGNSETGAACALAVQALAQDRGARVVQVNMGGWDTHDNIYDRGSGTDLYTQAFELDLALASMLSDLDAMPGKRGGTLLDETLVVATGEFGRTPGNINGDLGRDHYPLAWSALVAGGGVYGNQNFGATNEDGSVITDPFWSEPRYITIQDLTATMYSAMGVDWTREIKDTPSGRAYEYTPVVGGQRGYYKDIHQMFK